ncbi:hypothetical protein [Curtobacterium sp. RRHDQ10]|uniref:hypothetical protein n=1 Tax=Curtobacterium phyllosphaerae TaxID=3413379 RepID=UPI003BF366A2
MVARSRREQVRTVVARARLEPVYDRGIAAVRAVRARQRDRAWVRVLDGVLHDGVTVSTPGTWARDDRDSVPLVMCLWNRPERIEHVLGMLADLDPAQPVRLLLWNNHAADAAFYEEAVRDAARGSLVGVDLVQSPRNIGGLARFVAMRLLRNGGYRGPVAMLDDDQDVTPSFLVDLLRDWRPRSVVAWWGFSLHGSYWRRAEIAPGTEPDHAGTGGTVVDVDLVADDRFFARLPFRFAFLEDQWMTFFAKHLGWRVVKGNTRIDLVLEEKNQYHGLRPVKDVFHSWQQSPDGRRALRGRVRRPRWDAGRITPTR